MGCQHKAQQPYVGSRGQWAGAYDHKTNIIRVNASHGPLDVCDVPEQHAFAHWTSATCVQQTRHAMLMMWYEL